jgi:hypothetical protein
MRHSAGTLLLLLVALSARGQDITATQKGKKQSPLHCTGGVTGITNVTAVTNSKDAGCGSFRLQKWQLIVEVGPSTGGPQPVNPPRITASMPNLTKDVNLQHAQLSHHQQPNAASDGAVDLTKCKSDRTTDWIETNVGGSPFRLPGTIKEISNGWIYFVDSLEEIMGKLRLG